MAFYATGLRCLRCGVEYALGSFFEGCSRCRTDELIANLYVTYDHERLKMDIEKSTIATRSQSLGVWRHREFLPVGSGDSMVTLGEGGTPLIHCKELGQHMGLSNLYVKDESRNPTWSFKDRLCAVAVSKGLEFGARVITAASTGNLGASTAAYAARAGLPAIIFTLPTAPDALRVLMQVYGALVVPVTTPEGRWKLMSHGIYNYGWYPTGPYTLPTPTGNPYGVQGYKTIGYEILEQLSWSAPDFIIHPTAYGEGLFGTWMGVKDYNNLGWSEGLPRMLAAEPETGGPLSYATEKSGGKLSRIENKPTIAFSISAPISSYQGLRALADSSGRAVKVDDGEMINVQRQLASYEGVFVEPSSAASVAGAARLRNEGYLEASDTVVCVLTSSGLKDIPTTEKNLQQLRTIQPDWEQLESLVRDVYNLDVEKLLRKPFLDPGLTVSKSSRHR